ncbi:MAG: hypothetical protein ACKPIC_31325 [Microcystis panniformis]
MKKGNFSENQIQNDPKVIEVYLGSSEE